MRPTFTAGRAGPDLRKHAPLLVVMVVACLGVVALLNPGAAARPVRRLHLPSAARAAGLIVPAPMPDGLVRKVIRFREQGLRRAYVLVRSTGTVRPEPLVLVLPGLHETAQTAEQVEGWDLRAHRDRLLVVYASAYDGAWNAGGCCRPATRARIDDVQYLDRVLADVERTNPVDRRRVYLVGFSNGGMMAYRYACLRSPLLAAVAVVAGTSSFPSCLPRRPLSVLQVSGLRDRTIPFEGSVSSPVLHQPTMPVVRALGPWRRIDARSRSVVDLVLLPTLAHHWPTARTTGYDGTARIWAFLARCVRAAPGRVDVIVGRPGHAVT